MNVNYYKHGETTIAVAHSDCEYAPGINADFADYLVEHGYVKRSALTVSEIYKATATPRGGDVYDEETGRVIARDKVLTRYYNKCFEAQCAYYDAIRDYSKKIASVASHTSHLGLAAYKRNVERGAVPASPTFKAAVNASKNVNEKIDEISKLARNSAEEFKNKINEVLNNEENN